MKKLSLLLILLTLSAPLFLKQKLVAAQIAEEQDISKRQQVTELIKEYLTCGLDCPKKYKDAIVTQIARIRNINKKKALALIVIAFLSTREFVRAPITKVILDKWQRWNRELKLPFFIPSN